MEFKYLLLAVFVSFLIGTAYAATGDSCDASAEQIHPDSDLKDSLGDFTFTHTTTSAYAKASSPSDSKISSYSVGACANWANADDGYDAPAKVYWVMWEPTDDFQASVILTFPNDESTWVTRVEVLAQVNKTKSCGTTTNAQINNLWGCEAHITDPCQSYPTAPETYYFKMGVRYYFLFDSPSATATSFTFAIINSNTKFSENWETAATGTPIGDASFHGWTSTTTAPAGRGWFIDTPLNIDSPNSDPNVWKISPVSSALIGGTGSKIIAVNPFKNTGYTYQTCANARWTPCNHTEDILISPDMDLSELETATLEFESQFYDGTDIQVTIPTVLGRVDVQEVGTTTWTKVYDMNDNMVLPSVWYSETVDMNSWAGKSIRIRFVYENLSPPPNVPAQRGWALNNIRVYPTFEYDMCSDEVACTADTCSTDSPRVGCASADDTTTCSSKGVQCHSYQCTPEPGVGETVDEDGCAMTISLVNCDDGRYCTEDSCSEEGECQHTAVQARCNDGKGCTKDMCFTEDDTDPRNDDPTEEGCYFEVDCDDHVDCTDDSCVEAAIGGDRCLHKINFNMCEDFVDCTYELVCDPEQPGLDPVTGCVRIPMHEWCDDQNPCTIDTCQPDFYLNGEGEAEEIPNAPSQHMDRCVHTDMDCDDCIKCTIDRCEDGECVHEASNEACDDDIPCTYDYCNEELGKCENKPMDSMCQPDGDDCFEQYCKPGATDADEYGCVSAEKDCNDGVQCTADSCEEGQCVHVERDEECVDEAECTDDYCSSDLHKCVNVPNSDNCDDSNVCTIDVCDCDGKCQHPAVDCSDDIHCTDDVCDTEEGCANEANDDNCNDNIGCTVDKCDTELGQCTNLRSDAYCTEVMDNACFTWYCNPPTAENTEGCYGEHIDCNDGIPCTEDSCTEGECVHEPNGEACDDGHMCTDDSCDQELGCVNQANHANCEDGNPCTINTCECDGECHEVEKYCNDQIACTADYCDPTDGQCKITIPEDACNDGNPCTIDTCDVNLGRCTNIPSNDMCTGGSDCAVGHCSLENGCEYKLHHDWCDDHVACTEDVCQEGSAGCANKPFDSLCDDGHGCTEDKCTSEGCTHDAYDSRCEDGHNCTIDFCSTETGCHHTALDLMCNDGIDCTDDLCTDNGCSNEEVNCWCSDGVGCTVDTCNKDSENADRCDHEVDHSLCDDGWECSTDMCDPVDGCVHDYSECPWYGLEDEDTLCVNCISSNAQITQLAYKNSGTGALQFLTKNPYTEELMANLVILPTDQTIIGGASQADVPVASSDGLVLNDNLRIVPVTEATAGPCNEIRRGTIAVMEVEFDCGTEENARSCHRDQVSICTKSQQGYKWAPLSK